MERAGDQGGAEQGKLGDRERPVGQGESHLEDGDDVGGGGGGDQVDGVVAEGQSHLGEGGGGWWRQTAQLGGMEELATGEEERSNFWSIPEQEIEDLLKKKTEDFKYSPGEQPGQANLDVPSGERVLAS